MSYILRDRDDGQFEIVLMKPVLVGIFPEHDTAARVLSFLAEEPDLPEDEPAGFATAEADVRDAEAEIRAAGDEAAERPRRAQVPAVVERPKAPVMVAERIEMTEADKAAIIARLDAGESVKDLAIDFPAFGMNRIRGFWSATLRYRQRLIAEGGQQPCTMCGRDFTPSTTNPDQCARCAKEH